METNTESNSSFEHLGLHPKLLDALQRLKLSTPTPIQHQAIPVATAGKDMIGIAQTGTGKTFAFGLPMLQRLMGGTGFQGLILVPTRELAIQVEEGLLKVAGHLGLCTALLIGGAPIFKQKRQLKARVNVIIATPGRLIDHLKQKNLNLAKVSILVLDEADRMLDMGFEPQIREILKQVPQERQTMMFSATMPANLTQMAHSYMKSPLRIELAPAGTASEQVEQAFLVLPKEEKIKELRALLTTFKETVLVFTRTKHGASKLTRALQDAGFTAAEIHSDRTLGQRRKALEGFKTGYYRILVATDIAARGIDVKEIGMVVNFDLPENAEDYVHRIGRTGRAGHEGVALSFATPDQRKDLELIQRLIRKELDVHFRVPFEAHAPRSRGAKFRRNPRGGYSAGTSSRPSRSRGASHHRRRR
ncbi:DEAD/DEAH box helicase [Candidatus Peregrinibacteria bacterium]|nr:MAG: DEAD/DEAH box helicase [Candidatus Peregrinibacteria bacterium]